MFRLPKQYRDREILFRRLILFTAALILVIVYFSQICHFISYVLAICTPFFIGGALAFIFNIIAVNLMQIYKKVCHGKENAVAVFLSNLLAVGIVAMILILFLFLVLPHAIDSFQKMSATLPDGISRLYSGALQATEKIPYIHNWLEGFSSSLSDVSEVVASIGKWFISGGANDIVGSIYKIISTTFSWLVTVCVSVCFSIIVLFNKKTVVKEFHALAKAYVPEKNYESFMNVMELIKNTFTHYISGTCTECLILGTLVTVVSSIFQLPYSFLCGVVIGIGALVPMFGALVAAILMTIFICATSPMQALTFIFLFLCIQSVEGNFIYPHVVGKFVEFPPMYVIVAVTIGANVAGIVGMIISIPICSVLYQLIKENASVRIRNRAFRHI